MLPTIQLASIPTGFDSGWILLILNIVAVVLSAARIAAWVYQDRAALEWDGPVIGMIVIGTGLISGLLMILGYSSLLSPKWITIGHLVILFACLMKSGPRQTLEFATEIGSKFLDSIRGGSRAEKILLAIPLVLFVGLGLTALVAPVTNYDSLWYRLTRFGYWLQEENIRIGDPLYDPPLYFYPLIAPFLQFWLMQPFHQGYPLVHLAQFGAGIVTCLAVSGISRILFPSITWTIRFLITTATCLAMPAFAGHMMTSQTDLIVAALSSCTVFLILDAISSDHRRTPRLAVAGLAMGLLTGSKLTGILVLPGIVFILASSLLIFRTWQAKTLIPGIAVLFLFSAIPPIPRAVECLFTFGHPVAPAEVREKNTGDSDFLAVIDRFLLNSATTGLQFVSPQSSPVFIRAAQAKALSPLIELLPGPDQDRHHISRPRLPYMRAHFGNEPPRRSPSESEGMGLPAILLIGAALLVTFGISKNLKSPTHKKTLAALIAASFIVFASLNTFVDWFPYNVRYHLTWQVWLAAATPGLFLLIWSQRWRIALLSFILGITSLQVFEGWFQGLRVGYDAIANGNRSPIALNQEILMESIKSGSEVVLMNGYSAANSGFLRTQRDLKFHFFGNIPNFDGMDEISIPMVLDRFDASYGIGHTKTWINRRGGLNLKSISLEGDVSGRRGSFLVTSGWVQSQGFVALERRFYRTGINEVWHSFEVKGIDPEQKACINLKNSAAWERSFRIICGDWMRHVQLGIGETTTLQLPPSLSGEARINLVVEKALPVSSTPSTDTEEVVPIVNPVPFDYSVSFEGIENPVSTLEATAKRYTP
jgi:hypothetical protein